MKKEDFPADRGEDLGEYLGIKPERIATLRQTSGGDPDRLLNEVITEWFDNSWQRLAKAMKHCDRSQMSTNIALQEGMHEFSSVRYSPLHIFSHHANDSCIHNNWKSILVNNTIEPFYSNPLK